MDFIFQQTANSEALGLNMIHANFRDLEGEKHVFLSGVLTTDTKDDLTAMVRVQNEHPQNWVYDLENLNVMTSAGLTFFFELAVDLKNTNHLVMIRKPNEQAQELIQRSGLDHMVRLI